MLFAPPWLFTIVNAIAGLWGLYEVAEMTGALHWVAIPLFAVVGGVPLFGLLYGGDLGWVGWVVPLVVVSDSGAYFVGRHMGRTKLAPRVSPNKTVEGAVGGLIATVIGGWLLFKMIGGTWDMGRILLFSAMISILAQLGDLAGSALKRAAGVKDSGWIFPGHGGLLDRTCSLVFALFFTYYWFQ